MKILKTVIPIFMHLVIVNLFVLSQIGAFNVDFIFLSFGIMGFIVELFQFFGAVFASKGNPFKNKFQATYSHVIQQNVA